MSNSSYIWDSYDLVRNITLSALNTVSEEVADVIPEGFNNNIRWNFGHILVTQDLFMYGPSCPNLPANYAALFAPGTKPANWEGDVPSLATLAAQLEEQKARIKETFADRLDEKLSQPFQLGNKGTMNTIGELFTFSLFHEGMHMNALGALKKATTTGK
ncbi:DinB family protein [Brevibacillus centrosporus]|uniref:DinB superfamily protein n=1 Tax=Brevibacillus centrosporus TaxID=54910 RepID=A0A1I3SRG5_9BACL|nr:DinB family protein [Brevibacillus centrosporus]SFJ61414.1 DinB superfamily protein [Brevibacillus centrosporus]